MIHTLVYVGQETYPDEGRMWLFKEPESEPHPDEEGGPSEPPTLVAFSDEQLPEILDFDGLMQRLREVAVEHPLKPVPTASAEPASARDFDSVAAEVAKFIEDREYVGLTMTIRFTGRGLSLGRREGGYGIELFARPRLDPNEDSRILSLFTGLGVQPLVDYLSDRGRTRILEFPVPSKIDLIVALCQRVLTEVHSMRGGDSLDYHFLRKSDLDVKRSKAGGEV